MHGFIILPAHELGLRVPDKPASPIRKDDLLTAWLLWRMTRNHLERCRKWHNNGLGHIYICGHNNLLLSMSVDYGNHPVLGTATSRWKFTTTFRDFNDIGWNLEWTANQVLGLLTP